MRKIRVIHVLTRFDKGGSAENTCLTCLGLDPALYDKIQSLKATSDHTLLMSVPQQPKNPHLIPMLTSLREVDFVILRPAHPCHREKD